MLKVAFDFKANLSTKARSNVFITHFVSSEGRNKYIK